ncbi:MAG TPA: hypothetical protein VMR23_12085 [Candidatus Limnocylindria bacterium]|nr:hypothetical protein [Candidatus Limnocylindria bacterium]
MRIFFGIIGMALLAALPASAQQVDIETSRQVPEPELRVVRPPLQKETTRPLPDADVYPRRGAHVDYDPAFIEPLSRPYQTTTSTGRMGFSGWAAPNPPVGSPAREWTENTGWFALGFSITWDGPPPAATPPAPR